VIKDGGFRTTRWTVIFSAVESGSPNNQAALAELCRQYWYPIYAFARRSGYDALLGNKEVAISEAKRAVTMLSTSKDAMDGSYVAINLAVVYAWTNEPDLAFRALDPLIKTPHGLYYYDLELSSYLDPLRKHAQFGKLLAQLAPRN
jgi:hypothetical protein